MFLVCHLILVSSAPTWLVSLASNPLDGPACWYLMIPGNRSYMNTSKAELTSSICYMERFSKSEESIYNSEVPDMASRKARKRRTQAIVSHKRNKLKKVNLWFISIRLLWFKFFLSKLANRIPSSNF